MTEHLTDSQIAAWIVGEANEAQKRHLDRCLLCRAEIEETRSALEGFRQSVHSISSARSSHWRPEAYLAGHTRQTSAGTGSFGFTAWRTLSAGAAAILLILSALALTLGPELPHQTISEAAHTAKEAQTAAGRDLSDDALLIEVQTSVREKVPQALEPAELIAEERDRFVQAQTKGQAQGENFPEGNRLTKEGTEND